MLPLGGNRLVGDERVRRIARRDCFNGRPVCRRVQEIVPEADIQKRAVAECVDLVLDVERARLRSVRVGSRVVQLGSLIRGLPK